MKTHHKAILVACFCLPLMAVQGRAIQRLASISAIDAQPSYTKILQAAAPRLDIPYSELLSLYEDGRCTIAFVGNDSYQVKVDGGTGVIIVITDD